MTPQVIAGRTVPLGESDGLQVRRTLPTRERSLIGAWCFVDHYGPNDVARGGGMQVAPHPHTGLQTVSWLFAGEIEHRDSAGNHALIKRGECNLMTAGRGISHSEMSTDHAPVLHGVQLWVALPDATRDAEPTFEHYVPELLVGDGYTARVFIGSLLGDFSPVRTHTPLLGAELLLEPGTALSFSVDAGFEHGLLVDEGLLTIDGVDVLPGDLAYLAPGREAISLIAQAATRIVVLGGTPFGEQIVMWWNFIGRTHEEIVEYREQWEAELAGTADHEQFGWPIGDGQPGIHAPALPPMRLKSRG